MPPKWPPPPHWDECLDYLRPGDALVCVRLDRIGRSVRNLIEVAHDLAERKVDLIVLDQGLDTTTPAGRMMFHILGAIAEFEHDLISERTLDGLAASRARGRSGGRKPTLTDDQVRAAREMLRQEGPDRAADRRRARLFTTHNLSGAAEAGGGMSAAQRSGVVS